MPVDEAVKVDARQLAERDRLVSQLEAVKRKINHPLILAACRALVASGKPLAGIKEGYWPLHLILGKVHSMTGLGQAELPGADLVEAVTQLRADGILDHFKFREGGENWRDHDCYRVAADY